MQYRLDKYGNELSVLGFGCLRFPQKNGKIDMEATREQIALAVEQGVNYFDTAYVYGGSEAALGEILEAEGRIPSKNGYLLNWKQKYSRRIAYHRELRNYGMKDGK